MPILVVRLANTVEERSPQLYIPLCDNATRGPTCMNTANYWKEPYLIISPINSTSSHHLSARHRYILAFAV